MNRIFVKPGAGRKVLNADTQRAIRAEGEWINNHSQHRRFLKNGDLVPAVPPTPPKAEPAPAAQTDVQAAATPASKARSKKSKAH